MCECDSLHSCCELLILARDMMWHPGEKCDPSTWTLQTAKRREITSEAWAPELHESIRGEASVFIYIVALVLSPIFSARVYSQHKRKKRVRRIWEKSFWRKYKKVNLNNFLGEVKMVRGKYNENLRKL